MTERPVLAQKTFGYSPVTKAELDEAIEYAKTDQTEERYKRGKQAGQVKRKGYKGQELDRDLLRILGNTALQRRERKSILPKLAAAVVREAIPSFRGATAAETEFRYQGYKRGVMKIMSIRRVWQIKADEQRRATGIPIPERPKQTEFPMDSRPAFKNQRRLFS